jgi:hypothetical protein
MAGGAFPQPIGLLEQKDPLKPACTLLPARPGGQVSTTAAVWPQAPSPGAGPRPVLGRAVVLT